MLMQVVSGWARDKIRWQFLSLVWSVSRKKIQCVIQLTPLSVKLNHTFHNHWMWCFYCYICVHWNITISTLILFPEVCMRWASTNKLWTQKEEGKKEICAACTRCNMDFIDDDWMVVDMIVKWTCLCFFSLNGYTFCPCVVEINTGMNECTSACRHTHTQRKAGRWGIIFTSSSNCRFPLKDLMITGIKDEDETEVFSSHLSV